MLDALARFFLGHSLSGNAWKQTDFALPKSGLDDYWILCHVSPRWLCQMTKRFFFFRVCLALLVEAQGLDQMPVLRVLYMPCLDDFGFLGFKMGFSEIVA